MLRTAMQKKRSGEGGFTLIELLIVIVILGILAAIVVFAVGGITDKGDASACKSDAKNVEVAEEAYYASPLLGNSNYTTSISDLKTAKLLREVPNSSKYTITVTSDGVVHASGACTIN